MARFPGAEWNPIDLQFLSGKALTIYNRVNLHVAVSESSSLHGYFNSTGKPSSHFYVRKDGTCEQYVDTGLRAEADLDGNDASISIETQGGVTNANGEPWTDAQIETLAQIYAWAVKTHGIPVKMATDSRNADSSHGLSWHRLGIDPWRVADGMHYSTSRGKVCPGDAKIAQVPRIFARAQEILGEPATPVSTPPPAPAPAPALAPAEPAPWGRLTVDGQWGPETTKTLQRRFGTPADGVISGQIKGASNQHISACAWGKGGSTLVRAMQAWLGGLTVDGLLGPLTITALQHRMGTPADGVIDAVSTCVREMQTRLNRGQF